MASERAARTKRRRRGSQEEAALDALLERIHAVNPTGRALSRRRERALYEEKARLQSQLVEEFGESIDVRVHDDMPGIVSLSVPTLERSAGHAILDDLSVRARDVLEARLSDREVDTRLEHARRRRSQQESDVERARRFIDDYDFESAEHLLRERVAGANADAPQALDVLILLYTDHLGRDDDALRVAEENRHLATSSESRRALGVAATRIGRFDLALAHLRDVAMPERVNAVAEVVRGALHVRSWFVVRDALELLRRDAAYRSVDAFAWLREEEDQVRSVLQSVSAEEIASEEGLADLVDLLLPNHPARVTLRAQARERRNRESVERSLERLAAAGAAADRLAAEVAIADLEPMRAFLSAEELSRVDRASRALKSQRVHEAAREIVDLAQRTPDEVTLLSYLRLPSDVQAEAKELDETRLLELVERLSSSPHGDRAIARAAAAWHDASNALPDGHTWTRIAPHAAILAHVPEIARELDALRSAAPYRGAGEPPVISRGRPTVRSSSGRLRGAVATSSHPVEEPSSVVLADGLVHVDGVEWVAVVHRVAEDAHEVRLHPVQSGRSLAPIVLRLISDRDWGPIAAVASGVELHLVTAKAEHHVVSFEDGILVRDGPSLGVTDVPSSHVVCEGRRVALGARSSTGPEYVLGAAQPTRTRIRSASLEIRRGDETVTFSMPHVEPLMVIDSPKGKDDAPVLLELEPGSDRAFVWQQTAPDLWRGFRLRDPGVPIAARTMPSRGVLVITRNGPRDLRIERLILEGEHLRAARPLHVERGLGVVVDTARRRAWAVALDETTLQLSILSIGLRRAHRSMPA